MSVIRSYEYELSWALLDILAETPGVTVYGIKDTHRLEERVPTCAFTLNEEAGLETRPLPPHQRRRQTHQEEGRTLRAAVEVPVR